MYISFFLGLFHFFSCQWLFLASVTESSVYEPSELLMRYLNPFFSSQSFNLVTITSHAGVCEVDRSLSGSVISAV